MVASDPRHSMTLQRVDSLLKCISLQDVLLDYGTLLTVYLAI